MNELKRNSDNTIEDTIQVKKKELEYLKQKQNDILLRTNTKYNRYKTILLFTLIGLEFLFFLLIWIIGWNLVEPISWVITFLMLQGIILCYLNIFEKSFNLFTILKNKKESILNDIQKKENFNDYKINDLESRIKDLEDKSLLIS